MAVLFKLKFKSIQVIQLYKYTVPFNASSRERWQTEKGVEASMRFQLKLQKGTKIWNSSKEAQILLPCLYEKQKAYIAKYILCGGCCFRRSIRIPVDRSS